MREIVTTITQRGQVTVPAEIRRLLGVGPHDRLAFQVENGSVRVVPAAFTLESAFASVQSKDSLIDLDEAIERAKEEKAERTLRAMRDQ